MAIVKIHPKGQLILPKEIRDTLGIKPGSTVSVNLVDDHAEIRPLPDDPIEYLTGFLKDHSRSLANELLEERRKDNKSDEADSL